MPVQSVQCTSCNSWNTMTHYHHDAITPPPVALPPHDFDHPNDPPRNPTQASTGPVDQSCPIDGCLLYYQDPPNSKFAGHAEFNLCQDCGTIF